MTEQPLTPLFIGGTGRSGTTLLRTILARHPAVISLPAELRVIVDPDGALDLFVALTSRWDPYRADQALRRFFRLLDRASGPRRRGRAMAKAALQLGLSPPPYAAMSLAEWFGTPFLPTRVARLRADLLTGAAPGYWMGTPGWTRGATILEAGPFPPAALADMLATFFNDLVEQRRATPAQSHWVEDTPGNLLAATELSVLFPDRRLIHIHRDPRDVAASYLGQSWAPDDVRLVSRRLAGIMRRWFALREELPPDHCVEIGLERLCQEPAVQLIKVCACAGLPLDRALLDVPLDRANQGRWRTDLTREEQLIVTDELAFVLEAYGYAAE